MKQAPKYGLVEDNIMDMVLWGMPMGIVGARIYYIVFYLDLYRNADGAISDSINFDTHELTESGVYNWSR